VDPTSDQKLYIVVMTSLIPTQVNLKGLTQSAALNTQSLSLLLQTAAMTAAVPAAELTIARRRSLMHEAQSKLHAADLLDVKSTDVTMDLAGRSLRARMYEPGQISSDAMMLYFHGGGWVTGDLDTHHASLQLLSQHLGMKLLSVQYRKAPEHVFPAACDDAEDALAWAHARLASWSCKRISVSGDSAGGHLAAVAMHTHAALNVAGALLFYPVTDMSFTNTSYQQRSAGPGLTGDGMRWYWQQFLNPDSQELAPRGDPRAAPMRQAWAKAPPPTVILAAWHDPLYDEAISYAQLLARAGGKVVMQTAPDMAHGFLRHACVVPAAQAHVLAAVHAFRALMA
jgi:acetyl esterase